MSASAWDRAVVLAKHQLATVLPGGVACTCGAELAALNAPLDDAAIQGEPLALAVHQLQLNVNWQEFADLARATVAAALPVLLGELAQHIEAQGRDEVAWLADHASDRIDRARLIGSEDAWKSAIRVVRGFAAEVTQ